MSFVGRSTRRRSGQQVSQWELVVCIVQPPDLQVRLPSSLHGGLGAGLGRPLLVGPRPHRPAPHPHIRHVKQFLVAQTEITVAESSIVSLVIVREECRRAGRARAGLDLPPSHRFGRLLLRVAASARYRHIRDHPPPPTQLMLQVYVRKTGI